jgi:hypothetical protein
MPVTIRPVEYFNGTVRDAPGEAYKVLSHLAEAGVNMLAFSAVPIGPETTQLVLFPEDVGHIRQVAPELGITLSGPQWALLVQGDDQLGALAEIHRKLFEVQVNVYASSGVTDGRGGFGYLLYVRPEQFATATAALGVGAIAVS